MTDKPRTKPYRSYIHVDGRQKVLGYFTTAEEAAERHDQEAIKLRGEFAKPNFDKVNP